MEKLRQIAETLANLTVLEAKELSKILEDNYGIKPAKTQIEYAEMFVSEPVIEKQTEFDVEIKSIGNASKLAIVKLTKELTSLGLRESKELIDTVPCKIKEKISESEANEIKRQFEEIGAEVEIK